ncbi:MAG TPA: alpha/beta hydrolase [Solirubrobacterales bacterium]
MEAAGCFEAHEVDLHGHRAVYRTAGRGPTVVLIHGMLNSSRHWQAVAERLAVSYRVVAPDLIGHGDAATPRGDYSLGAHAASIRDLLTTIGIERATIVGHSLGGGVAMQFFYQFPQRTERLVLISSGGLGHDVSPLLRGAALPGASQLLRLATRPRLVDAIDAAGERLRARGNEKGVYLEAVARALRPLREPGSRRAFLQTLRSVIDVHGQHVSAADRLYLLGDMATLIVWGERDRTIPIEHGRAASEAIPRCRFETLQRAAHFPHLEDSDGLAATLADFLAGTAPVRIVDSEWAAVIAQRAKSRLRAVA